MVNGLAERLKDLRIKAGFSQREVARQMQLSPSLISGYETGERTPSAENLLALAFLYRCSTDYLLGKETERPKIVLDLNGLSEEQIQALINLVESMRK